MNYNINVLDISNYVFPVNSEEIFNNKSKTALEIGFGEGEFLVELAERNSDWNFIGIEIKKHRYKMALKLAGRKLTENLRLLHFDAELAMRQVFAAKTFDVVYINFPDPWPKRRHLKHRLFNQEFVNNISKVLVKGGQVRVKTDHHDYITNIVNQFAENRYFFPVYDRDGYISDNYDNNPETKFEKDFTAAGKKIFSATFTNLRN